MSESNKNLCSSFAANWEIIKVRLRQSNVAKSQSNVVDMVSGLIKDEGDNNAKEVCHRRWFLYPFKIIHQDLVKSIQKLNL